MNKSLKVICITFVAFFMINCSSVSTAQKADSKHLSDYSGQEKREIKSLSKSDLDELRTGKGWGLAKAAELNGFPGPVHLLEMKEEIELSQEQLNQIEQLYQQMKKQAIPLGLKLIELEKELDESFKSKTINEELLAELLEKIAGVYRDIRYVHLSVHLKTPKILTKEQINEYNKLRGYSSNDPCSKIPEGHDPEMWKKHNNCK